MVLGMAWLMATYAMGFAGTGVRDVGTSGSGSFQPPGPAISELIADIVVPLFGIPEMNVVPEE
jgi:hypothetical protein